MKVDKSKVGTGSSPTLTSKPVAEIDPGADARRVAGMPADNEYSSPITDPQARTYATRLQERALSRKASVVKGKAPPIGHVEPPSSDKMSAIAEQAGMAQPQFQDVPEDMQQPPDMAQAQAAPAPSGVGAAYPVNQALARGQTNGPVSLKEGAAVEQTNLSPETIQALKMAQHNVEAGTSEPTPPTEPPKRRSIAEETRDEISDIEKDFEPESPMADVDFSAIADIRNSLMSTKRREEIEGRLEEMDINDMIMKRELVQKISIVPGKLEITLRTFNQRENLWILKYIYDYPGSDLYVQELLNTCRLVCSLVGINNKYLPDHRKEIGTSSEVIDKDMFEKKMFSLASFPVQLVADFSVQSIWFQDRVDKLFSVDEIKNG